MIDDKSCLDVPIKSKEETFEKNIKTGQNNDYTTSNLLNYEYFSNNYKLIAIDLTKQIKLEDADTIQQINFIGKLERNEGAQCFSSLRKQRKQILIF